uniref:Calmodulin-lysine N-methyltransferase n=1 Tax=Chrysotila carterae TaxID=13221 RepID=A0A7S4B360_CHRCT
MRYLTRLPFDIVPCRAGSLALSGRSIERAPVLRMSSDTGGSRGILSFAQRIAPLFISTAVLVGSVNTANNVFGILDNTADELADLLHVDEASPAAVATVKALRPLYEPVKAMSASCTDGIFPEFNDVNDLNDCLLLRSRIVWRTGPQLPLRISQTMKMDDIWKQSTGSSIWGGGLVLAREMEEMGRDFWAGKRVLELGTGTGLGGITAAKLGAAQVVATDRDEAVLQLASRNARENLGARASSFRAAPLEWGTDAPLLRDDKFDVLIGADLTYNREGWTPLLKTVKLAGAPMLLSASERRPDELNELQRFLELNELPYRMLDSPFTRGYASTDVKLFWIEP